ncbi:MAG: DUF5674 family protein [Candidatus Uhrbacteria bacterium]
MSEIRIITDRITISELKRIAEECFGDMVKAVVDIEQGIMAIGGELHADEEAILLGQGSSQNDLWGINLYPDEPLDSFLEYDSMINIRPGQGNRSRDVEDEVVREKIKKIVSKLISN